MDELQELAKLQRRMQEQMQALEAAASIPAVDSLEMSALATPTTLASNSEVAAVPSSTGSSATKRASSRKGFMSHARARYGL